MNRNKLKSYAPQARRDFIQAVTARAAEYGLTGGKIEPMTVDGDVAVIGGRPYPKAVGAKRAKLAERIERDGFEQVMEHVAYTWFNRLVAIRFMELHGYLDHGYRVLSPSHHVGESQREGANPEILEHAEHVDLPGIDKQKVVDLKLDGTKDENLYRMLLIAQCNSLHQAMPFLFESIDDETELLLPDNLLHSDSLIRDLVTTIPEEDWQEVEIIGWLYQFYISKKKAQVIGKVVKSEDIPAATQLFTPNWIVKYLVQNSLGRQWMATYLDSPLKAQMEYYIEPAEQTPEVQEQLEAITPDSLDPEELTLLDPACGSGHILVEAYDLLKTIYQERGYSKKDIPRLILTKNLYGLEIDDRAAQLAAFALMMKARTDDRRIFAQGVQPHVLSIRESKGLDAKEITEALNAPILKTELPPSGELFEEIADEKSPLFSKKNLSVEGDISQADVAQLVNLFEHGKTFGSLIQIPEKLAEKLPAIAQRVNDVIAHGGMFEQGTAREFRVLVQQVGVLANKYGVVAANPPYMGNQYYTGPLKSITKDAFRISKADLYACFVQRHLKSVHQNGFVGMITIPNWMFLSSFADFRKFIVTGHTIDTFVHNGRGVFGSDFGSCSFVIRNSHLPHFQGVFRRLFDKPGSVAGNDELQDRFHSANTFLSAASDFEEIPGNQIAYWASPSIRKLFTQFPQIGGQARKGISTGNNVKYVRFWWEVSHTTLSFFSGSRWFPVTKGGPFRRWYGNFQEVLNYENDGTIMRQDFEQGLNPGYRMMAQEVFFHPGVTWSDVSIAYFSARHVPTGFIPMDTGPLVACDDPLLVLSALNSRPALELFKIVSPAVHFSVGHVAEIPVAPTARSAIPAARLVEIAKLDWDSFETSWDFQILPILRYSSQSVRNSQEQADSFCRDRFCEMKRLEEENNSLFIEAYGLQAELSPEVPDDQITLYRPDREEDIERLISYAIGCMMGRYSLDKPGLIYAHSGGEGFDPSQYQTFPADSDGIVPLTEFEWFEDDAANRLGDFIATAWPKEYLEENLKFIAESIGQKKNESARDAIRRYLSTGFYKHHLSLYKRRPIYWLFSSGKQRGFQALVYLHRYNEGTLARMRTAYVIPLLGKMTARIDHLTDEIAAATSSQHRKRLEKEKDKLTKQHAELQTFDEKLRHYADQRIHLDLDDGVKVNYGKFGDLLAEVKAVTGQKPVK